MPCSLQNFSILWFPDEVRSTVSKCQRSPLARRHLQLSLFSFLPSFSAKIGVQTPPPALLRPLFSRIKLHFLFLRLFRVRLQFFPASVCFFLLFRLFSVFSVCFQPSRYELYMVLESPLLARPGRASPVGPGQVDGKIETN